MTTSLAQTTQRYLIFQLVDQQLVMLPVDQLAEVFNLPLAQVVSIPDVPASVMGVCNWRGEVTWVVDLGYLLGFPPLFQKGFSQTTYKIGLLQVDNQYVGLAVPKIGEMISCSGEQIQDTALHHISGNLARCLRGYFIYGDRQMVLAIDGHDLIQLLEGN